MLLYQFIYRDYFSFVKIKEAAYLEIDLGVYVLFICALIHWKKMKWRSNLLLPLTFWLSNPMVNLQVAYV